MDLSRLKFSRGETLTASKLNALVDAVNEIDKKATAATITDVEGGEYERSQFGTKLTIPQITPGGDGDTDLSWDEDGGGSHPFKVSASYIGGTLTVKMKGGRWHGNGYGNYLGISYLDTPMDELTTPPESVGAGEDLFFIPDCTDTYAKTRLNFSTAI